MAERKGVLAVVEVRARRSGGRVTPAESITPAKREAVRRTAARWAARNGVADLPLRSLLAAVDLDATGRVLGVRIEPLEG